MVLVLFRKFLRVQDSTLSLPAYMIKNLDFPLEVTEEANITEETIGDKVPDTAFGLFKTYWNLAWFGGIHILSQWATPKGLL